MSVSTEVQRTLVKSPPELWAELGNTEGLARHLGELGEIRVTQVEPESKVEWEADRASGIVQLKQSGWGTRVTLSLTRELPAAKTEVAVEPAPVERESLEAAAVAGADGSTKSGGATEPESATPESATEPESVATAPEPEPEAVAEQVSQPDHAAVVEEQEIKPTTAAEPKRGFFARLFKRGRRAEPLTEPEPQAAGPTRPQSEPSPPVVLYAMALPEPIYPDPPPRPVEPAAPAQDLAAELAELEAQMQRESTELLTGVLDRLGAAHHRPFSRG